VSIDPQLFRSVLRHWASGVTIVTTRVGDQVAGMTASAFSSVSLAPPLVLVCIEKKAHTLPWLQKSGVFAVNVLAQGQHELSNRFATTGNEAQRFDGIVCRSGPTGAPWLPDTLAVLDCRVTAAHDAGDHFIYVGAVETAEFAETREPLVHYDAKYRALAPT
jgi:3-hydroxy-9,10-secoandrosta-1,3,5(10)-triene-9,17-dione monooxygenase reductase component